MYVPIWSLVEYLSWWSQVFCDFQAFHAILFLSSHYFLKWPSEASRIVFIIWSSTPQSSTLESLLPLPMHGAQTCGVSFRAGDSCLQGHHAADWLVFCHQNTLGLDTPHVLHNLLPGTKNLRRSHLEKNLGIEFFKQIPKICFSAPQTVHLKRILSWMFSPHTHVSVDQLDYGDHFTIDNNLIYQIVHLKNRQSLVVKYLSIKKVKIEGHPFCFPRTHISYRSVTWSHHLLQEDTGCVHRWQIWSTWTGKRKSRPRRALWASSRCPHTACATRSLSQDLALHPAKPTPGALRTMEPPTPPF